MNIVKGKVASAKKIVVYGPEGIGKSTFAAQFPNPLFIDTEGSTKDIDVGRFDKARSWSMLQEQVHYVRGNPSICKTLIVDTIDWAEQLCIADLCARNGKKGIEDFGYGNGYVYAKEEFGRFLNLLEDVIEVGVHAILTAHAQIRKFEQPDEMGAYDRWELKLGKKTSSQTAPLVKEWADMVLFANYKTMVYNVDGQGAQKGKNKVQGGKRIMYTSHHPCWDAKNRYGLPEEMDFSYDGIAHIIEGNEKVIKSDVVNDLPIEKVEYKQAEPDKKAQPMPFDEPKQTNSLLPKGLIDLMKEKDMSENDIMEVAALKGYFPKGTPLSNCGEEFINGWVIPFFGKICEISRELKLERGEFVSANQVEDLPFN